MKRLLFLYYFTFFTSFAVAQSEKAGVIDLSSVDFSKGKIAKLNGTWKFYFGKFLKTNELAVYPDMEEIYVPSSWYGKTWRGEILPDHGFATYYAKVMLDKRYETLTLAIPDQANSYKLIVNNSEIIEVGRVGENGFDAMPGSQTAIVEIPVHGNYFDIIFHVSNFSHKKGGVWDVIKIGTEDAIRKKRTTALLYDAFLVGAMLIIALYHIGIFTLRSRDYSTLFFSILAVASAFRLSVTGQMSIMYLFPDFPWEWKISVEHVTFYIMPTVGLLFARSVFPNEYSKKIVYPVAIFSLGLSLTNIFTKASFHSYFIIPYEIILIPELVYIFWGLGCAIKKRKQGAIPFLLGFIIIFATAINDILFSNNVVNTFYMVPIGIFFFFFSQAFVLSAKSARAFDASEALSAQLKKLNEGLEEQVKLRTVILEDRTEELAKVNMNLQATAEELEANSERLTRTNHNLEFTKDQLEIALSNERKNKEKVEETLNQLKSTQSQLIQSEKMASLGQLVAGIAHEINNPINFVNSGADVLQTIWQDMQTIMGLYDDLDRVQDPMSIRRILEDVKVLKKEMEYHEMQEDVANTLADIRHGAERTIEIVKGLRTFSRTDESISVLTDLHECLDSALIILKNQYKNRIEIQKNYADKLPLIPCRAGQINQIFMNIIANAIHAIPEKGIIKLTTALEGEYVVVKIQDSGAGIPKIVLDKIFDPFFTTKPVGKGTGLGLSISHSIIQEHGGGIKVISQEGEGATFVITLPLEPPKKDEDSKPNSESSSVDG